MMGVEDGQFPKEWWNVCEMSWMAS